MKNNIFDIAEIEFGAKVYALSDEKQRVIRLRLKRVMVDNRPGVDAQANPTYLLAKEAIEILFNKESLELYIQNYNSYALKNYPPQECHRQAVIKILKNEIKNAPKKREGINEFCIGSDDKGNKIVFLNRTDQEASITSAQIMRLFLWAMRNENLEPLLQGLDAEGKKILLSYLKDMNSGFFVGSYPHTVSEDFETQAEQAKKKMISAIEKTPVQASPMPEPREYNRFKQLSVMRKFCADLNTEAGSSSEVGGFKTLAAPGKNRPLPYCEILVSDLPTGWCFVLSVAFSEKNIAHFFEEGKLYIEASAENCQRLERENNAILPAFKKNINSLSEIKVNSDIKPLQEAFLRKMHKAAPMKSETLGHMIAFQKSFPFLYKASDIIGSIALRRLIQESEFNPESFFEKTINYAMHNKNRTELEYNLFDYLEKYDSRKSKQKILRSLNDCGALKDFFEKEIFDSVILRQYLKKVYLKLIQQISTHHLAKCKSTRKLEKDANELLQHLKTIKNPCKSETLNGDDDKLKKAWKQKKAEIEKSRDKRDLELLEYSSDEDNVSDEEQKPTKKEDKNKFKKNKKNPLQREKIEFINQIKDISLRGFSACESEADIKAHAKHLFAQMDQIYKAFLKASFDEDITSELTITWKQKESAILEARDDAMAAIKKTQGDAKKEVEPEAKHPAQKSSEKEITDGFQVEEIDDIGAEYATLCNPIKSNSLRIYGDMHASLPKLDYLLRSAGIIENTSRKAFLENIQQSWMSELRKPRKFDLQTIWSEMSSKEAQEETKKAQTTVETFKKLLQKIELTPEGKTCKLVKIGDDYGDRSGNDLFNAKYDRHLIEKKLNLISILSNHTRVYNEMMETAAQLLQEEKNSYGRISRSKTLEKFRRATESNELETLSLFDDIDENGDPLIIQTRGQAASSNQARRYLLRGCMSLEEALDDYNAIKKMFRLIDYSVTETDELIIKAHAPFDLFFIQYTAEFLGISQPNVTTSAGLRETIDQIKVIIDEHIADNTLSKLITKNTIILDELEKFCRTPSIDQKKWQEYIRSRKVNPFALLLWNRKLEFLDRPTRLQDGTSISYVYGHDTAKSGPTFSHAKSLDNAIGKPGISSGYSPYFYTTNILKPQPTLPLLKAALTAKHYNAKADQINEAGKLIYEEAKKQLGENVDWNKIPRLQMDSNDEIDDKLANTLKYHNRLLVAAWQHFVIGRVTELNQTLEAAHDDHERLDINSLAFDSNHNGSDDLLAPPPMLCEMLNLSDISETIKKLRKKMEQIDPKNTIFNYPVQSKQPPHIPKVDQAPSAPSKKPPEEKKPQNISDGEDFLQILRNQFFEEIKKIPVDGFASCHSKEEVIQCHERLRTQLEDIGKRCHEALGENIGDSLKSAIVMERRYIGNAADLRLGVIKVAEKPSPSPASPIPKLEEKKPVIKAREPSQPLPAPAPQLLYNLNPRMNALQNALQLEIKKIGDKNQFAKTLAQIILPRIIWIYTTINNPQKNIEASMNKGEACQYYYRNPKQKIPKGLAKALNNIAEIVDIMEKSLESSATINDDDFIAIQILFREIKQLIIAKCDEIQRSNPFHFFSGRSETVKEMYGEIKAILLAPTA